MVHANQAGSEGGSVLPPSMWPAGHPARGVRATREIRAGMTNSVKRTHSCEALPADSDANRCEGGSARHEGCLRDD
jgi:hypothetical protein